MAKNEIKFISLNETIILLCSYCRYRIYLIRNFVGHFKHGTKVNVQSQCHQCLCGSKICLLFGKVAIVQTIMWRYGFEQWNTISICISRKVQQVNKEIHYIVVKHLFRDEVFRIIYKKIIQNLNHFLLTPCCKAREFNSKYNGRQN